MDLASLRALLLVTEYGSFQQAAVAARVSRGGLHRQVERLEKKLDLKLLRRGARGVELTVAGAEVAAGAAKLLRDADALVERARSHRADVRGVIRFIVPAGIAVEPRAHALETLRASHPDLDVAVVETEDPLTLLNTPFDCMMHFGDAPDRDGWFSHILARLPAMLRATPAYLDEHGRPTSVDELDAHTLLQWTAPGSHGLPLRAGGSFASSPWLQTGNLALLHKLAADGVGILYAPVLPPVFTASDAELELVLDDVVGCTVELRALSPRPSRAAPKLRALLENGQALLAELREAFAEAI